MKKSVWYWEKHDVVNYLRANFLESEEEFTCESLLKRIANSKTHGHYFGYTHGVISKYLDNLASEGYLEVRYVSEQMRPNTDELPRLSFSNKWNRRWGGKTTSIYKMSSRDKKIEKILN